LKKFDSINIIPFVDIMLVLLAIVLTTFTLVEKKEIQVILPQANSTKDIKRVNISITITKDGAIYWEDNKITKDELQKKVQYLKKEDSININCHKDAKFEDFLYLLDTLKSQNLNNIAIVTKKNE